MAINLTGEWEGRYLYPPGEGPPTAFRATLRHGTGLFTGSIIEPHFEIPEIEVEATVAGYCDGVGVDFTKTYRSAGWGYEEPVDYVGQLASDGNRITGVWSLLDWNGRFFMLRRPSIAIAAGEKLAAEA